MALKHLNFLPAGMRLHTEPSRSVTANVCWAAAACHPPLHQVLRQVLNETVRDVSGSYSYHPRFTDEVTEAQSVEMTRPESHS